MAITYTYSFNCTVKYRLSGEDVTTESPLLSDSTNLYICTSELPPTIDNKKVVIPTDLTLPLPNYLQGVEDEIKWYLTRNDNTYSDEVTSGKLENSDSTVSDLTVNKWRTSNAVQTGTFISCDAAITLFTDSGQKTLIWKYNKEDTAEEGVTTVTETEMRTTTWQPLPDSTSENYPAEYANFISLHAPKIPTWVASKNGSNSTLYVFTGWKDPVKAADVEEYTIEANYSETTYNETNPYTLKSANPFADAEPYHYGVGTPPGGYFIPIGEDNDPTNDIKPETMEIKVQAAENNGYSEIKNIDGFKINNRELQYIEKGTFPLPHKIYESRYAYEGDADNGVTATTQLDYRIKKVEGDEPKIVISKSSDGGVTWTDAAEITTALSNCTTHNHAGELPKRLGFILTGGGGGAGGVSRFDPKSDGKNNDYTTPGGGGGGGEIVCGILDLTDSTVEYRVSLGLGGAGGPHYEGDPDYDSPKEGKDGEDGKDSIIYVKKSTDTDWTSIYCVGGGKGGKGGGRSSGGEGGRGGYYQETYALHQNLEGCVLCQRFAGGDGGGDIGENKVQNEALSMKLYFSTTVPEISSGEGQFYISREYESITSSHNPKNLSKDANVPGGHSFGRGGTEDVNPIDGAGGCCNKSGGRDGAGGYFGIYY